MQDNRAPFKSPSKKHQPKGLSIIYEDQDIVVVNKINGLLTMGTDKERDNTAYSLLTDYVKKGNSRSKNRVFIVHRLDRDTSGILVFAKHEKAKRYLQDNWKEFSKKYFAVVQGQFPDKEGVVTSYLVENKLHRVASVTDAEKGKLSKTGYKVMNTSRKYSLLEVTLFTGRKHQIRVHFSDEGHPVVGDKMYGNPEKGIKRLALHSASLTILHPHTHKEMSFTTKVPAYFKMLVNIGE